MTQSTNDIAIRVEHLGKRYRIGQREGYKTMRESMMGWLRPTPKAERSAGSPNDFWALNDVNFEVKRGEVVGIIGRNGAGKSTLLKVLSRITEPTTGRVEITGRVGSLLEVGTGFHPELTGRENVFLNGAILGMRESEIRAKFDEIVAFAEIEQFIDTPVKRYSSGMYTRLAFAVAAHLEPEILIIDEVLAVGDAAFQKKCLGKMKDVAGQGRTVLFVSHQMSAIQQLCSRVALFRAGMLQLEGPPGRVIGEHLSDAIASRQGVFDLGEHSARGANYKPLIRRVVLTADDGGPRDLFLPNEPIRIDLTIVPEVPIRNPIVAVAIEDSSGRRLTSVSSSFHGNDLADIESQTTVRCTIDRLRLGTGRYLVSVSIGNRYGLLDSIDGMGWIDVGWDNDFGNGDSFNSVYGPVLTHADWLVLN